MFDNLIEVPTTLKMSRVWAMPTPRTFTIKPIHKLLMHYAADACVVDPFARNSHWGTYTNDLNPETAADYHMDAVEILDHLIEQEITAGVVLLDPPYSVRQVKECYDGIGRAVTQRDTQWSPFFNDVKDRVDKLLEPHGTVISFGWNSIGMGKKRGYQQVEIMLVCHGGVHNDTIVTVETKT